MGARSRVRLAAGVAVALLLMAPVPGSTVGTTQAVADAPLEALVGTGPWRMRVWCIGCIAAWAYVGSLNPALMVYHAIRTPALVEGCSLLCLQALE